MPDDQDRFAAELGKLRDAMQNMHLELMGEIRRLEREGMQRSTRISGLDAQQEQTKEITSEIKKDIEGIVTTLNSIMGIIKTWRGGFVALGTVGGTAAAIVAWLKGWLNPSA